MSLKISANEIADFHLVLGDYQHEIPLRDAHDGTQIDFEQVLNELYANAHTQIQVEPTARPWVANPGDVWEPILDDPALAMPPGGVWEKHYSYCAKRKYAQRQRVHTKRRLSWGRPRTISDESSGEETVRGTPEAPEISPLLLAQFSRTEIESRSRQNLELRQAFDRNRMYRPVESVNSGRNLTDCLFPGMHLY